MLNGQDPVPHPPGPAVVSGGSSGIGLACAAWLVRRGTPVILVARGADALDRAARRLAALAPHAIVRVRILDVTDLAACRSLATELQVAGTAPSWIVAAAGMARPGRFLEQRLHDHRLHMEVNYFGTLNLIHALSPAMLDAGGHVVMISSGAALAGVAGYGAYGPSKFAVRGLAETLRVELARHGIVVTLAFPPDTDTQQWHEERRTKPPETAAITAGGGLFSAERVADDIMAAAAAGRFAVTTGTAMTALLWLHSLAAPLLRIRQQRLLRRWSPASAIIFPASE